MSIEHGHEDKVYYGGKMQLLNQPEFNDVEKATKYYVLDGSCKPDSWYISI